MAADLSALAASKRSERAAEADVAQLAERVLGKDEVTGSIPVIGSSLPLASRALAGASWLVAASFGWRADLVARRASAGWQYGSWSRRASGRQAKRQIRVSGNAG